MHLRKFLPLSMVVSILASQLMVSAQAQSDDNTDVKGTPPVVTDINLERKLGEGESISRRERYFWAMRGIDLGPTAQRAVDYSALRQAAVEYTQRMPAYRGAGFWSSLGPAGMSMLGWNMGTVNGRIAAFAQSPASTSTLLAGGASGGLWRSTNGGASWASVSENLGTQTIGSIWFEPGNASRVWVGTGERNNSCVGYFGQGLYLSTDGGQNFTQSNGGGTLTLSYISSISTSPSPTANVLVAGTGFCNGGAQQSGGIFRSTNGGGSWSKVVQGSAEDVIFLRSDGNVAYAAVSGNGVLKSNDAGANWNRLSNGLPTPGAALAGVGTVNSVSTVRIATVAYDSRYVYSVYRYSFTPSGGGNQITRTDLFRTLDAGANWSLVKTNVCDGQCSYNVSIDIDPIKPADGTKPNIILGFIRPWLSTDGGATFNVLTNTWGSTQQVHQDTHVVRFARLVGSTTPSPTPLWIGSDGGLWRTDNLGSSFSNLNNGMSMTQFYDIAVHPSTLNAVFGGTQDNSSTGRFNSNTWSVTHATGDGGMNAFDTGNPSVIFQFGYTPANGVPYVTRSDQNGAAGSFFATASTGLVAGEPFDFIAKAAGASGFMFLGSSSVYRASTNVSANNVVWTKIANNLTQGAPISVITPVRKVATDPLTLYVGDSFGRIWRLFNVTATNTPPTANVTNNFPTGTIVTDIAVDPNNLSRIFATRGGFGGSKLYYSGDQAATWVARGGGLPDVPVNSVAVDPNDGAVVYVATDVGVFRSFDGGVSFQSFNTGLPTGVIATDLEVQGANRKLYVATYGRGVYIIDI